MSTSKVLKVAVISLLLFASVVSSFPFNELSRIRRDAEPKAEPEAESSTTMSSAAEGMTPKSSTMASAQSQSKNDSADKGGGSEKMATTTGNPSQESSTGKSFGDKMKDGMNSAKGWASNAGESIKNSYNNAKDSVKQTANDVQDKGEHNVYI